MKKQKTYVYNQEFQLESGRCLSGLQLFYTTLGNLNKDKTNVVWVCHAFSGSSDVTEWWPGLFGKDKLYDPEQYFIICINMPGGCYGSTGPLSINPETSAPYYHDFPVITNRDIVRSFDLVRKDLGINKIHTVIGCSMGGQQAIEWAVQNPNLFEHLIAIGANAQHSPWAIAFNESQRLAIKADNTWNENRDDAGIEGMKAARAIALISYRNYHLYNQTQKEPSSENFDNFRASSYQQYQGEKMAKRFNAFSYYYLSKAMDSQNVGRGNGGILKALSKIRAKSLFMGIDNDILFPSEEQKFLANNVKDALYVELDSIYGHDGFLLEFKKLTNTISKFYRNEIMNADAA